MTVVHPWSSNIEDIIAGNIQPLEQQAGKPAVQDLVKPVEISREEPLMAGRQTESLLQGNLLKFRLQQELDLPRAEETTQQE